MPCTSDKPEARADAGALGGEEGIEDALEHLRRDAGAGVAHGERDVAAGRQLRGRDGTWLRPGGVVRRVTASVPPARIACTAFAHRFITTW